MSTVLAVGRFAFLATIPVVLVYWLAYFIILTKRDSPEPEVSEESHLTSQPPPVRSLAKSARHHTYQAIPTEGRSLCDHSDITMM